MPIKLTRSLPVRAALEEENIFVMDKKRAVHQDIRPLQILILNLMPQKEATELQLLRALSNTALQVEVTFLAPETHRTKNQEMISHTKKYYRHFREIRDRRYDGLIITGAPVELLEFEEVDYWDELVEIMEWSGTCVTSTLHICWGAQAALYHFYGIKKYILPRKLSGVYRHRTTNEKIPLVRGFDDEFYAPHSRNTENRLTELYAEGVRILAESDDAGFLLGMTENGRKIFIQGHLEYDRATLDQEYRRDLKRGISPQVPEHYYYHDDRTLPPVLTWRAVSNSFYSNWLNYYVYQITPYNLYGTPDFSRSRKTV